MGGEAPSILEETFGYQPPEVWAEEAARAEQQQQQQIGCKGNSCSSSGGEDSLHRPPSYDIWCVGVIFLIIALGTTAPLEPLDARRSAKVRPALAFVSVASKSAAVPALLLLHFVLSPYIGRWGCVCHSCLVCRWRSRRQFCGENCWCLP